MYVLCSLFHFLYKDCLILVQRAPSRTTHGNLSRRSGFPNTHSVTFLITYHTYYSNTKLPEQELHHETPRQQPLRCGDSLDGPWFHANWVSILEL